MSKVLVTYFSASGVTAKLAELLAKTAQADLHEIQPAEPYTAEDLNWNNKNSRSSLEMADKANSRPAVANRVDNMDQYDTIYVGFPIWWGTAPTVVNSFLEQYDLSGKTVIPFATSGGSPIGASAKDLAPSCKGAEVKEGARLSVMAGEEELKAFIQANQ